MDVIVTNHVHASRSRVKTLGSGGSMEDTQLGSFSIETSFLAAGSFYEIARVKTHYEIV